MILISRSVIHAVSQAVVKTIFSVTRSQSDTYACIQLVSRSFSNLACQSHTCSQSVSQQNSHSVSLVFNLSPMSSLLPSALVIFPSLDYSLSGSVANCPMCTFSSNICRLATSSCSLTSPPAVKPYLFPSPPPPPTPPRVVTKTSSCRVNTTSRRGIKRLGISFGSIFLLFSNKSSRGPLS